MCSLRSQTPTRPIQQGLFPFKSSGPRQCRSQSNPCRPQGAGSKRAMTSSSLLLPAGKRLAMPALASSLSNAAGRPLPAFVNQAAVKAACTASLDELSARVLSTSAASVSNPQLCSKKPSASLEMQGAPQLEQPDEPTGVDEPGRKLQAPASALKIPDLPDLSLELPPPRSHSQGTLLVTIKPWKR